MFDPDLPSKVYLPTQLMNSNGGLAISNLRLFNSTTQDLGESPGYICLRDCEFESQYSTLDESFFPLICLKNVCLKRPKMAHLKKSGLKTWMPVKTLSKAFTASGNLQDLFLRLTCWWGPRCHWRTTEAGFSSWEAFRLVEACRRKKSWWVLSKSPEEIWSNLEVSFAAKRMGKLYCFLFRVRRP